MKRLCTKEASRKTMHYILLLAWLVYIPYVFLQYGLNQAFLINLGFASLLLILNFLLVSAQNGSKTPQNAFVYTRQKAKKHSRGLRTSCSFFVLC